MNYHIKYLHMFMIILYSVLFKPFDAVPTIAEYWYPGVSPLITSLFVFNSSTYILVFSIETKILSKLSDLLTIDRDTEVSVFLSTRTFDGGLGSIKYNV